MKFVLATTMLMISIAGASAQYYNYGTGSNSNSHNVQGYTNNHGTTVDSYQRTNPNSTQTDNFGSSGNYNPYSGSTGTHRPRY